MKKVLLIAILLFLYTSTFAQVPTNGLVAYYPFNGNANNAVGSTLNGTVNGATLTTDRYGQAGKAYSFDGINDEISLGNPISYVSKFTISLWQSLNNGSTGGRFIYTNAHSMYYNTATNRISGRITTSDYSDYTDTGISTTFIPNTWNHVVMKYDGVTLSLIINGLLKQQVGIVGAVVVNRYPPGDLRFGSDSNGQIPFLSWFNGKLDDIRYYNRALSDIEVANLYGAETNGISLTTPMRFGGGLSTLNVGTNYNFTAGIKNNSISLWTGDVYLKVLNGTPILIASNQNIVAGGTLNLNTNFSPQTTQIGQLVPIELMTKQGSNNFESVAKVNGTVNPLLFHIEPANTVPTVKVPFIKLNQSEVSAGSTIQIIGGNFEPNTQVNLSASSNIIGAIFPSVTTGADGSLNMNFTIPTTYASKYLTLVAIDSKKNNPTVSLKVTQPIETATLKILGPYVADQKVYMLPNGSLRLTLGDKLLKGSQYPLSGSSRSHKYSVSFKYVNNPSSITPLMDTDVWKGLVNSDIALSFDIPLNVPDFGSPDPTGNPRKIILIVKDFYDPTRIVESVPIWVYVENSQILAIKAWDRSWNDYTTVKPTGVAADGVSRIFLKIKKAASDPLNIQSVSVSLSSPENSTDPKWLGRVKYSTNQNIANPTYEHFSSGNYSLEANGISTITVQSNTVNTNNEYWFWYVAPDDFQTSTLSSTDALGQQRRSVKATFTVTMSNGTIRTVQDYIEIVRPPLMMVHGWMGDETSFSGMDDDSRFQKNWIIKYKNVMKQYAPFDENSRILLSNEQQQSSFQYVIDKMRFKGFASNQVDYVCHSMGGLMLRNILSKKDDNSMETEFFQTNSLLNYSNKNYQKGWVHKYITINTPHFGSPGADLIAGLLPLAGESLTQTIRAIENGVNAYKSKVLMEKPENLFPGIAIYDDVTKRYIPSDAVKNMQTNSSVGGKTNFKRLDNVKSHVILSDIDEGLNEIQPTIPDLTNNGFYNQLFVGLNEENEIGTVKKVVFNIVFALLKDITKINPNSDNSLFSNFIIANRVQLNSIWKPYLDAISIPGIPDFPSYIINYNPKGIKALTETMGLWGNYNGKYSDYLWNGDAVVPLKSQLSGLPTTAPNVSLIPNLNQTDLGSFHVGIQDKANTINRVFQLMNKSISDIEFGYLEGNNFPQKVVSSTSNLITSKQSPSLQVNTLGSSIYEVYDNSKIKIVSPINNTSVTNGSILNIKISALDTVNLKRVELLIGSENISYSGKFTNYEYQYDVSKLIAFKKTKLLAIGYYFINNEYYLKLDSVSISVSDGDPISGFEVSPKSKQLDLDASFVPLYILQYANKLSSDVEVSKLNVSISNTSCLSYDVKSGQLQGLQKGEAVVIFTYNGILRDTMYVAVGGGGVAYPQQISTGNVPITGDGTFCTGATISVPFTISGGVFNSDNKFTVQLSNASGNNFISLETTGSTSPLIARIPNGLLSADTYKVRVISTSPPIIGVASTQLIKIRNQDNSPIMTLKTGNWNDLSVWACGRLPSITDVVTIKAGHIITIPASYTANAKNVIFETGGKIIEAANTSKLCLSCPQIPTNGLIAYYPLNGNANDASGNSLNGSIVGSITSITDRKGVANSAYQFSGVVLNYISIPDNALLCSNIITLNAWVNFAPSEGGYIINKGRDIQNGSYRLGTGGVAGQVLYNGVNDASYASVPTNQWVMVTGIINGNNAKYYVNGVMVSQATLSSAYVCSSAGNPLTIGNHYYIGVPNIWAYPYKGKIDDVRIYNRALSDAEVLNIYNAEKP